MIDCAMVDGAALISALTWSLHAAGMWKDERGANLLDSGAAFYDSYECADGQWVAVGALEPQFFAVLKEQARPGLRPARSRPARRADAASSARQPRDHWCALLEGSDACFAPILSLAEAPRHPHNVAARAPSPTGDGYHRARIPRPASPRCQGID